MPKGVDTDVAWPADAVEVGRIVDAFGVKGWLKVQPYAGQPEALAGARRWHVQPGLRQGAAQTGRPPKSPPGPSSEVTPRRTPKPAPTSKPAPAAPAYSGMVRVLELRDHGGDLLVARLDEVDDRSAAEALKGARLFVSRASFPTPQDGEYYWVDLIGLDVVNRQDEALGQVSEVFDTGAHSVLRVMERGPEAVPESGPDGAPEGAPDGAPDGTSDSAAPAATPRERLIPFVAAYVDAVDLAERRIRVDWLPDYD